MNQLLSHFSTRQLITESRIRSSLQSEASISHRNILLIKASGTVHDTTAK